MDLKDAIKNRHSVRSFTTEIPSRDTIDEILTYAHLAPSAGNLQARDFIIIDDADIKEKLSIASYNQRFITEAPFSIVVCANIKRIASYGVRGTDLYCIQDASAAVEHILLLAVEYGLDTCWVGAFDEHSVSKILDLPPHIRPVAIIPIGYAKKKGTSSPRMNMESLTHHNQW